MAKRKKYQIGGRTDEFYYGEETEGRDIGIDPDLGTVNIDPDPTFVLDPPPGGGNGGGDDSGNGGGGFEQTNTEKVLEYAGREGVSELDVARYITKVGANVNAVADAMGIDRGTANTVFNALSDDKVASFIEYQELNPNATNQQLAQFVKNTGADINLVADALQIDRAVGNQMYKDALGSTELTKETEVTGIKKDTEGTYQTPTINIEDYVQRPEVEAVDIEGAITPESAIQKLTEFTKLTPPPSVTATQIKAATASVADAITKNQINASQYEAALVEELNRTVPAVGTQRPPITVDEIRDISSRAQAATMGDVTAGLAQAADFTISPDAFVPGVTAADIRVAQTPEIEAQQREAITGTAGSGIEAQILETVNYQAAQTRAIKGTAAKGAAASMVAEVGELPNAVASAIVEDPASVEAIVDTQPIEVQAAVAALPNEALVSSQLETLLGGLEDGQIPTWARPAVDMVEQRLAQRGMEVSTVARDALFNAIIQTSLPIAESNAQALQQRAAQNLSNEQQAALQQQSSQMQLRLQNLANQQTAASQTAQMAQSMAQLQSQFRQDAALLSAQQAQQIRTQNLANRQRSAELNAQNQQAANAQNLSNEQQMELANLEAMNLTERENMTAENQARLAEFQVAADFISKNAAFKQQMELANLDADQQVRLANLTALNNASSDNLNAAQQTELANLNARMQTNLAQAQIAQAMGVAQLNADQQRAVENARMVANIDLTKFNADQQVQLANSQFMQTVTLTDFNARQQAAMQNATALASLDLATVDQRTRLAIENANNFLQMDIANLSNAQQAVILDQQMAQQRLLSDQSAQNAAAQFNAATEAQINQFNANLAAQVEQFNASQLNAMAQFNVTEQNRVAAINAGNEIDVQKFNNQLVAQLDQFNAQMDQQREIWNAQNAQAIEQSNIEWRRQANTINTAAENAANATAAQQAYNLSTQELANVWQQLRDDSTYARTAYQNDQQRKTTLYATALSNDPGEAGSTAYVDKLITTIDGMYED